MISRIDLAHIVAYVMALIRNISIYLNRLPSNILTNGTVKSCAGSIDDLVASYIYGLQVIGLSTSAFVDLALKQGLTAHDFSPLLPKSEFPIIDTEDRADFQLAPSSLPPDLIIGECL